MFMHATSINKKKLKKGKINCFKEYRQINKQIDIILFKNLFAYLIDMLQEQNLQIQTQIEHQNFMDYELKT